MGLKQIVKLCCRISLAYPWLEAITQKGIVWSPRWDLSEQLFSEGTLGMSYIPWWCRRGYGRILGLERRIMKSRVYPWLLGTFRHIPSSDRMCWQFILVPEIDTCFNRRTNSDESDHICGEERTTGHILSFDLNEFLQLSFRTIYISLSHMMTEDGLGHILCTSSWSKFKLAVYPRTID